MKNLAKYAWLNGQFIESTSANLSMLNHSLHYSGAVFEGIRSYNGKIFKLEAHMARLNESAKLISLDTPYSQTELCHAAKDLLAKNKLEDTYIRPIIFRQSPSLQMYSDDLASQVAIFITESAPRINNNTKLTISRWRKAHPLSLPPQSKSSANYAPSIAAQKEANQQGFDDALMLDLNGFVAECTVTNIFFALDNNLVTPVADNFLNGITRQEVIQLATKAGMSVTEIKLKPEDIVNYDSCFVTGTSAEIKGVASIALGDKVHKFTNQKPVLLLQDMFRQLVRN